MSPPASPFAVAGVKDSYYRLPFPKNFGPGSGYMNIDDPVPGGRHPESQAYAYDLTAPEGTPVLAARGGTVVLMEDDDPLNADDWPPGYQKIGNFIWLEHEDGTFAVYFHNKKDTADVALGQTPRRGAQLAETGNTGQSTGPHVHFGLFTMQGGNVIPGTRARLEAFTGAEKTYDGCYIPRNGQPFFSTNGPLLGD